MFRRSIANNMNIIKVSEIEKGAKILQKCWPFKSKYENLYKKDMTAKYRTKKITARNEILGIL